jgi:hypothetical protein
LLEKLAEADKREELAKLHRFHLDYKCVYLHNGKGVDPRKR